MWHASIVSTCALVSSFYGVGMKKPMMHVKKFSGPNGKGGGGEGVRTCTKAIYNTCTCISYIFPEWTRSLEPPDRQHHFLRF